QQPAPQAQAQPEPAAPAAEERPEPGTSAGSEAARQAAPPPAPRSAAPGWQPPSPQGAGVYVTPVVRKLAADSGVDLTTVTGTGVGGRIRREDVLAAAEQARKAEQERQAAQQAPAQQPAAAAPSGGAPAPRPDAAVTALIGTTQKTPRIRQSIARNMLTALTTSAQLTTVIEVDVTRVATLRQRAKAAFESREGVKLSFLPFFVKAAVEAAKAYPVINSSLSEDLKEITYHPTVNMGIAVDTPRGLIVPVIKNADDLNIGGIARRIADLAARTRDNKIGPDELSGGTLTLTNTGSVGALFDTAIFTPPQSAILITGAVVKRPVVVPDAEGNDVIAIRSMAYLALSYDHRNVDGADAARYLGAIKKRIEDGDFEAELGL
ncbi:MAG TPA: 2-oxoglutarate dehydrogenase, E2 component, dihydrolipoamide succinyltransferase, partial [Nakamurella sp.]|nr:2-oxoglutarate dehydrogenase, E2 component, dihydrolipoamide succinyltransferase [Nakamurella sp.]